MVSDFATRYELNTLKKDIDAAREFDRDSLLQSVDKKIESVRAEVVEKVTIEAENRRQAIEEVRVEMHTKLEKISEKLDQLIEQIGTWQEKANEWRVSNEGVISALKTQQSGTADAVQHIQMKVEDQGASIGTLTTDSRLMFVSQRDLRDDWERDMEQVRTTISDISDTLNTVSIIATNNSTFIKRQADVWNFLTKTRMGHTIAVAALGGLGVTSVPGFERIAQIFSGG